MAGHPPIDAILDHQGVVILDGGLATELERLGHDLDHPLWSARVLMDKPTDIGRVHRSFLDAGSDCIITATYQATTQGLVESGMSHNDAQSLILTAVDIACTARDAWLDADRGHTRPRPAVAASIGPYGAYLADGSEYRGDYGLSVEQLYTFHEPRWTILAQSNADLLACETIPSLLEARALLELLHATPDAHAWFSFSCRDERHLSDGTPLAECAALLKNEDRVLAAGVNCTAPRHVPHLIDATLSGAPNSRVVVYPNSGEVYDASHRIWTGVVDRGDLAEAAVEWYERGARLIGGCCRTTPDHIRILRQALCGGNSTSGK